MKSEKKTTDELLEGISKKLDKIIGVIAIQGKDTIIQIKILKSIGLSSSEIADMLGLTDVNVRKIIFRNKIK
ncbi:MAG: hypothetical protein KGI27_02235 [Thaumarchaeota archaeon]|nr:hypothetical protein [Nitrososphaerota archaeon]